MDETMFRAKSDYLVPILKVLAGAPNGTLTRREVIEAFWQSYGHRIPPDHQAPMPNRPTAQKWNDTFMSWARQNLYPAGLLDGSTLGIWRITEVGREWLKSHPDATHMDATTQRATRIASRASPRSATVRRGTEKSSLTMLAPTLTLEMLEQTRQAMGEEQFRAVWGAAYDQILAVERAKTITDVSDKELQTSARAIVQQIQDYLQGQGDHRPSAEQLCDWIHFCYQFALYRESEALFTMVDKGEVNDWYYERTRKIAVASRRRI